MEYPRAKATSFIPKVAAVVKRLTSEMRCHRQVNKKHNANMRKYVRFRSRAVTKPQITEMSNDR
jgi:hypothetical protein